jgi:hypothetical protein
MSTVTKAVPVTFEVAESDQRELEVSRSQMVDAARSTGQVIQGYADSMTVAFGALWFDAKGSIGKAVKVERAEFKAAMILGGFAAPTVDVYWQRVKVAAGYITAGNKAKGDATLDSKTLSELKTILNRILGAEEDQEGAELSMQAKASIIDAFETMGGNVETDLTA